MLHFCTIVNAPFLLQGLALHASIQRTCSGAFGLWVLCADDESYHFLAQSGREGLHPLSLAQLEQAYPTLTAIKRERTAYEYIATLKPFLVRYLLETQSDIDVLSSLDADLLFFSDPAQLLQELGDGSVLLSPHHFSSHLQHLAVHGQFNGGFIAFRSNDEGKRAAQWWSERVAEWCADRIEGGRRSNQKYLEEMSALFHGVIITQHPGVNLAPWNIDGHQLSLGNNGVEVDGKSLVFYHFHHLTFLRSWLVDPALAAHKTCANHLLKHRIYAPYLRSLLTLRKGHWQRTRVRLSIGSVRYCQENAPIAFPLLLSRLRRRQWFLLFWGRVI